MWIPAKNDRVYHLPTKAIFTVQTRYRNEDLSISLFDQPKSQGNEYRLEDCLPLPTEPLSVGQKAIVSYKSLSDEIVEIVEVTPIINDVPGICNYTVKSLEDNSNKIWTVQWFHLQPHESDRPLNESELQTLSDIASATVESQCRDSLAMLEELTLDQKRQLWAVLTPELRQGLKELKEQPTQLKSIASPVTPLAPSEGLRTIIAGSRTITDYVLVEKAILDSGFQISTVISGKEPNGVDRLGEIWAEKNGVPVKGRPALWKKHGRAAGPIRNKEMIVEDKAEALILVWVGDRKVSPGSFDMLAQAIEHDLQIYQVNLSQQVEVVAS